MTRPAVCVVDASVAVEYVVQLPRTAQATGLFRRLQDPDPVELWAPDLLYLEVASVLRKLVHRKSISAGAGERALGQLSRLPIRISGTAALLPGIWKLRARVTPYDAAYLCLARELDATLVTGDERLAKAAGRRFRVQTLADL
ncbi:MAG: type II toxin-antitoxin system VapC family toxin [Myxococcales bacterium]|jgi:predicted nucleic acid-binding protein